MLRNVPNAYEAWFGNWNFSKPESAEGHVELESICRTTALESCLLG